MQHILLIMMFMIFETLQVSLQDDIFYVVLNTKLNALKRQSFLSMQNIGAFSYSTKPIIMSPLKSQIRTLIPPQYVLHTAEVKLEISFGGGNQ